MEFSGTQTILVTLDVYGTNDEKLETKDEPMMSLKLLREEQLLKQVWKLVTAVFLSNNPDGMDCKEEQPEKQLEKVVTAVFLSKSPDGIDRREVQ